jgi:hypothetical protein
LRDGKLVAYLIGDTTVQPWGRCGYIYLPGYGLAKGEDPMIVQDLYALLGEAWNQQGCFNHYAYICAADRDIVDAWFNLGFGKERVDALLDLRIVEVPAVDIPTAWQSANLLAARFWPRFGFKPVAFRLARMIHPAIAWAKG